MAKLNLDLDRVSALSKEPPHVLPPDAPQSSERAAGRVALRLLAVTPEDAGVTSDVNVDGTAHQEDR